MGIFPHAKIVIKIPFSFLASVFVPEVVEWVFVRYIPNIHFPFFFFLTISQLCSLGRIDP